MNATARKAATFFPLLAKLTGSPCSFHPSPRQQVYLRRFISGSSSEGCRSTGSFSVMDSLGFSKWQNGGGLIHKSARVDPTTLVQIGAVVHPESVIEGNVHLGSGTVVGPSVLIGHSTKIGYNVALSNCSVGHSCIIHHGVCIGQDGFGFFVNEEGYMMKKPQMLHVKIGSNVEIGSGTCIDRGSWRDTVIGDHSKIDNLVQIGHNVAIGKCCILCGQVGIAGSVTIGDYVTMGGRAMVRDHVSITSKVRIAANSGVTKSIAASGDYGGFPAVEEICIYIFIQEQLRMRLYAVPHGHIHQTPLQVPIREWHRQAANIRKICRGNS